MFQTEWTAYLKTCGWEKAWYFSGIGGYFLWRELECRVCMSLKEKCKWMGGNEEKKKAGNRDQLIMSPCRSQVTQGFISHIRRWIFSRENEDHLRGLGRWRTWPNFYFGMLTLVAGWQAWKEAGQLASTWSEKGQWSEPILDVLSFSMSI